MKTARDITVVRDAAGIIGIAKYEDFTELVGLCGHTTKDVAIESIILSGRVGNHPDASLVKYVVIGTTRVSYGYFVRALKILAGLGCPTCSIHALTVFEEEFPVFLFGSHPYGEAMPMLDGFGVMIAPKPED